MTNSLIANRRIYNQRIAGSLHREPEEVVKELGAMQAQDYMQAVWAIGSRTESAALADVERAIADQRIVLTWTLRGTIHFVPPEDVKWMLQLSAPRLLRQAKQRLAQLGLDEDILKRCRVIIYHALKGRQVTRSALMQRFEDAGISTAGQRGYHILWHSAYQGLICFGPKSGKEQTFVLLEEWVAHSRELSFEDSLAELALRYFAAHGPATVHDFAWWAGLTLTDARLGLEAVKRDLLSEQIDGGEYWMSEAAAVQNAEDSGVHLLAGFDEYILGYKDRSAVLEPERAPLIVPGNNGFFLPVIVADSHVIGTWKRTIKEKGIELIVSPFDKLGDREERVLKAADRYAAFIGLPISKVAIDGIFA